MMNKERLYILANTIEELEDSDCYSEENNEKKFSMGETNFTCGSPSCIAGHAYHLFSKEPINNSSIFTFLEGVGKDLLGLTWEQSRELFVPDTNTAYFRAHPDTEDPQFISAKRAANTLRHLAETGTVNWDAPPY